MNKQENNKMNKQENNKMNKQENNNLEKVAGGGNKGKSLHRMAANTKTRRKLERLYHKQQTAAGYTGREHLQDKADATKGFLDAHQDDHDYQDDQDY